MTTSLMLIPEWEKQDAVILSWPHPETDWYEMLAEIDDCYKDISATIVRFENLIILTPEPQRISGLIKNIEQKEHSIKIIEIPTNDTWIRDYGPLAFRDNERKLYLSDFTFNGWGMKFPADRDNRITRKLFSRQIFNPNIKLCNCLEYVLEGGSVESDGLGTILTTKHCLFEENRNAGIEHKVLLKSISEKLGANRLLLLEHGLLEGDDTDGHVDTLARFLTSDTIAYTCCEDKKDAHFMELQQMEKELKQMVDYKGEPYKLVPLPLPEPIYAKDGHRLPATYANFLFVNGAILFPVYGVKEDKPAAERLQAAINMPVILVNCRPLIEQHGSLHCATMQIPQGFINFNQI